ncbi:tetratricopeptide repeat protein [Immundisolibacter sp.]
MKNPGPSVPLQQTLKQGLDLFQAGQLSAAESVFRQLLQALPGQPDALHFLGMIAHQSGDSAAAVELIGQAIRAKPSAPMYCNLGIALQAQGELDAAIENYRKALALNPAHAELHQYLADSLKAQGNLEAAVVSYTRALGLRPDLADAYIGLGNTLHHLNRLGEAEASYRKALALPDRGGSARADVLNEYAMVLFKLGRYDDAAREIRQALQLKPDSQLINQNYRATLARLIPHWHFSMLADHDRNAAFRQAIDKHCAGAGVVLEIGTGSGLLAMMAARAGAGRVVTCEAVPVIADNAARIIAANGYGERISVHPMRSTGLMVGRELPQRADVLLAEILSSEILAEGALDAMADARERLLRENARVIPAAVTICAALVSSTALQQLTSVHMIEGFDLSLFNEFAPYLITVPRGAAYDVVSETFHPYTLQMGERLSAPTAIDLKVRVSRSAPVHGIAQWMKVHLDEEICLENAPAKENGTDHWGIVFHPFAQPVEATAGQDIALRCEIDGTALKMRLA